MILVNKYGQHMVKIPHNWLSHPDFFAITDPNLGPISLQISPMTSNMTRGTLQSTGTQEVNKMDLCDFNCKLEQKYGKIT